jgi:HEPN domain-containing protein
MKDETLQWLKFAEENLQSAKVLLESKLYNPCLQNAQQAVEKMLKAVLVERAIKFKKTHSIGELTQLLAKNKIIVDLAIEDRELLDSIYLPSKYPLGSVLPNFEPDKNICRRSIEIAEKLESSVAQILG